MAKPKQLNKQIFVRMNAPAVIRTGPTQLFGTDSQSKKSGPVKSQDRIYKPRSSSSEAYRITCGAARKSADWEPEDSRSGKSARHSPETNEKNSATADDAEGTWRQWDCFLVPPCRRFRATGWAPTLGVARDGKTELLWQDDQLRFGAAAHTVDGSGIERASVVFVAAGSVRLDGDGLIGAADNRIIRIKG